MKKKNQKLLNSLGAGCGIFLVIVLLVSLFVPSGGSTAGASASDIPDGAVTVSGTAAGRNGPVSVEVVTDGDAIYSVRVTDQSETNGIGSAAVRKLPEKIYKTQSLLVDGVTGATITSDAIKNAVRNALDTNGIATAVFDVQPDVSLIREPDVTYQADVVIIGAGGAGMTAAIEASDAGRSVILIETMPMVGGNSVRSTGGLNAAKTHYQDENSFGEEAGVEKGIAAAEAYPDNARIQELAQIVSQQWEEYQANPVGYFDSVELFQLDTLIGGGAKNDPALVKKLAESSADAIDWLGTIGGDMPSVSSFGGASVKRIHRPVDSNGKVLSVGAFIVPVLESNLESRMIKVLTETTAEEILLDSKGAACGVRAVGATGNTVIVKAGAVIDTAGGFGANHEMVESYKPELAGFMSTNAAGIQGQGIAMAQAVGADVVDMAEIQIHPTVEANTASLITEGLRGDGAILVNQEGLRFYDEVSTRDKVSAAEIAQTGSASWLVVDNKMFEASNVIQGYVKNGYTVQGDSYEELAEAMGVPADVFADTMETWNGYVAAKNDPDFGRTSFAEPLDQAPYYAIHVTAGIHHTMGGVKINDQAQVIDTQGNVIPGLFAAGEVTGGVHGGNRLGGNAVADFVIFGRIAGTNAAGYAKPDQTAVILGLLAVVALGAVTAYLTHKKHG